MIKRITYIESSQTNPYRNLALEEALLTGCDEDQCILYLWQNQNTVVIGRNQNAWNECRTGLLEAEGGHLARRLSGGGAVYHDLGNLNFTFLVRKDNYSVDRQLAVIQKAMEALGAQAVKSGRNDLLIDGRKFSGNAFYRQGDRCYHHGTLMMNVDTGMLGRYLTVSREKLASKGVDSVHSRVMNLTECIPDLTLPRLKSALRAAFEEVYHLPSDERLIREDDWDSLKERAEYFGSWEWLYGRKIPFQHEFSRRFPWGGVSLGLTVDGGTIREAAMYSDALEVRLFSELPSGLAGCPYRKEELCAAVESYPAAGPEETQIREDLLSWLREEEL